MIDSKKYGNYVSCCYQSIYFEISVLLAIFGLLFPFDHAGSDRVCIGGVLFACLAPDLHFRCIRGGVFPTLFKITKDMS
jgi:hypothetical protein